MEAELHGILEPEPISLDYKWEQIEAEVQKDELTNW
jgi:hypothetical protein